LSVWHAWRIRFLLVVDCGCVSVPFLVS
jgi:hypothetical protein